MLTNLELKKFDRPTRAASAKGASERKVCEQERPREIFRRAEDGSVVRRTDVDDACAQTDLLCRLIGRGSTVLDIGAGVGTHAIAFSKLVGPMGRVLAFEARAAVFDVLSENLTNRDVNNITAAHLAIADRSASSDRNVEIVASILLQLGAADASSKQSVRAVAIDDLQLERCDLVKIDAGGTEALVIKGMRDTISRLQPIISCECGTIEAGVDLMRLLPPTYGAFLVRYSSRDALEASEPTTEFVCNTSLLLVPSSALSLVHSLRTIRDAEIIAVRSIEELAAGILATPRRGDASSFARDPVRLCREVATLEAALSSQNVKLLEATRSHMQAAQRIDALVEELQADVQGRRVLENQAEALRADLDRKESENVRLRFRAENMTRCARLMEDKLDRANDAREGAVKDLVDARRELELARATIDDNTSDLMDHRDRLADALVQIGEQSAKLGAAYDALAGTSSRLENALDEIAQFRGDLAQHSRRSEPMAPRRDRTPRRSPRLLWIFSSFRRDYRLIAASGLFDAQWYLAENSDVATSGVEALQHYLEHGAAEHRDPSADFCTANYIGANPDVARAGVNPLAHYIRNGRRKGRAMAPDVMNGGPAR